MADVDALIPYGPEPFPTLPGGEPLYIVEELGRIQTTITKLIEVLALLEARIVALEPP
jgi:hypothetical protein